MKMYKIELLLFFMVMLFSCNKESTTIHNEPEHLFLEGNWQLVWQDEFDGVKDSSPSEKWFYFYGWANNNQWRDAYYTQNDAYLNGEGQLIIRARVENDTLKTSYLRTFDWSQPKSKWSTFGVEKGKYFEASIKLSSMVSGGLWTAFWLFATENEYDGNPSTGTEIDIMEHVVSYGDEGSWTKNLPNGNTLNHFNVATHWGNKEEQKEGKFLYGKDFDVNIHDGEFHRFGLLWTQGKLTYYLDEIPVYTITKGVSSSNNQAIILSMEYDAPPNDAWGLNENVLDYLDSLPNYYIIDYVSVYSINE